MTRVLHFSDVHIEHGFAGVPLRSFLNKRALGLANLRLRRGPLFAQAIAKVGALSRFMADEGVDLCVCTGDYTALGTDPELSLAREVIEPLTKAPRGFVTVPGNHDVYLPDALEDARFARHFGDLLGTDLPELSVDGVWPQVRLIGDDLAVIAINSSRPNPELTRSSGRVPEAQLDALGAILEHPRVAGRFVIVATHYALRRADGLPDRPTHGLENDGALIGVLARVERGVYLHGHIHRRYHQRVPGLLMDVCGAGSATQAGREGLWVIDVEGRSAIATPGTYRDGRYVLEPEAVVRLGSSRDELGCRKLAPV
jgi:3',5'-cyclic AMP phosphodiesterase CpdA